MKLAIKRCEQNPIVYPGIYKWRNTVVFNPASLTGHMVFLRHLISRATVNLKGLLNYVIQ